MINLYLELIFDYGLAEALFLNAEVCIFMQGLGPYSTSIKKAEKEIKDMAKKVNDLCGMKFILGCLLFVVHIIVLLGLLTLC